MATETSSCKGIFWVELCNRTKPLNFIWINYPHKIVNFIKCYCYKWLYPSHDDGTAWMSHRQICNHQTDTHLSTILGSTEGIARLPNYKYINK